MSSRESEERTMVFTCEKNDTSNQNRQRCFFTCEKNDASNQKPQWCVSFAPKFPPFLAACWAPLRTHSRRKVFLKSFFSLKKWKTFQKWSGIVSFVSLSIKKTVASRWNNSGRGKTEQQYIDGIYPLVVFVSLFLYLIQKQLVCKYRTPALSIKYSLFIDFRCFLLSIHKTPLIAIDLYAVAV